MQRRRTRSVAVKNFHLGSDYPIAIQTMWDKPIANVDDSLIERIDELQLLGCSMIRFGLPTMADADRLLQIADKTKLAVVADIHFDYKIALRALDGKVAKLRLNPGNIGTKDKVQEIARKALDKKVPIRIGVNGGSLDKKLHHLPKVEALVASALDEANALEQVGFGQIVISIKDSNPRYVLEANRKLATLCDYPLHLGITEAGPLIPSITKSALFLGMLLEDGIGDTIRISISDVIEKEVMAARQLLLVLGINQATMPMLVSCPRCARNSFDTHAFAQKIEPILYTLNSSKKVAVMGCVVNGPGEAADADLAISGVGKKVFVYSKGKVIFEGDSNSAEDFFMAELYK